MDERVIAQRDLRNNIGQILRDAEAGVRFTITVRGRSVATLGPVPAPEAVAQTDVDDAMVAGLLARTPVDDGFAADLRQLRAGELPSGDPWPTR